MSFSPQTIDRIVANVLTQLSEAATRAESGNASASTGGCQNPATLHEQVISERIVTAEILLSVPTGTAVRIPQQSIVTPAGWDILKERRLQLTRGTTSSPAAASTSQSVASSKLKPVLLVVTNSRELDQLAADLSATWDRQLLGCPDEAAQLAISSICRGERNTVLIAAQQAYRAACLANRQAAVRAVPIQHAGDVNTVRGQLRANVWCCDPTDQSYFELKNLLRTLLHPST